MAEPTEEERKKYGIELSSTGGGIRKSKLKSLIHIYIYRASNEVTRNQNNRKEAKEKDRLSKNFLK